MSSFRLLALPAAALLTCACQPSEEAQDLLRPLSDASSAISADSGVALASMDAASVFMPPAPISPVTGGGDGGGAVAIGPVDGASQSDTAVMGDSAAAVAINDAATFSDAAIGDGSATGDANSPGATAGACSGSTPHGCWRPKSDNPMGCPPQIHEQSDYYPPLEEWVSCESPYYERCIYLRPDGTEAYCACDLGVHWLCTY